MAYSQPIWNSRIFVQNQHLTVLRAEGAFLCGIGCCPETGLKATGIPPHLVIAGKVQTLINECKKAHGDAELMRQTMLNDLPAAVARAVGDSLCAEFNIG
jgi:hypothetical protein